jgi:hypothetical protein
MITNDSIADPPAPFVSILRDSAVSPEQIERMSEEHWSIVAKMAGSAPPPERVRLLIARRIRELQYSRRAVAY